MSDLQPRFCRSPVDYEAWRNGYMPPSEHVLIHELSVGGTKVVASSAGSDTGWWLVVKGGKALTPAQRKSIRFLMENMDEDDAEPLPSPGTLPRPLDQ